MPRSNPSLALALLYASLLSAACGGSNPTPAPLPTSGLTPMSGGQLVYDGNQKVYWLADANLAGDPAMRAALGISGINTNGTMNYQTALNWVDALNHYQNGSGYLGHTNWQLPVTAIDDPSCAEQGPASGASADFAAWCSGSALGNLYRVGLGLQFSSSVAPGFTNTAGPFQNLQPALYWSATAPNTGTVKNENTYSFLTGAAPANTTVYNYFHVLPVFYGAIGNQPPAGTATLRPYVSGPAAGKAVYDSASGFSWPLDANLAATQAFNVSGSTPVSGNNDNCTPATDCTFNEPQLSPGGAMLLATATPWLSGLNQGSGYAGAKPWVLPQLTELQALATDLGAQSQAINSSLVVQAGVGPFQHLQPFLYWACQRAQSGSSQSPCDPGQHPGSLQNGTPMEWSFNFDSGFQGTDENTKEFYVMVYYPAP